MMYPVHPASKEWIHFLASQIESSPIPETLLEVTPATEMFWSDHAYLFEKSADK